MKTKKETIVFSPRFVWKLFMSIDRQCPLGRFTSQKVKAILDDMAKEANNERKQKHAMR